MDDFSQLFEVKLFCCMHEKTEKKIRNDRSGLLFVFIFVFSTVKSKIFPKTGFEMPTCGIGSDHCSYRFASQSGILSKDIKASGSV